MRLSAVAAFIALTSGAASAGEFDEQIRHYLNERIMPWASEQLLVDAIVAQNSTTESLSESDILAMDRHWRDEVGSPSTPTITPVLTSDAANFLRDRVSESGGAIMEVFIMDARGLNVAASDVTSDYWQGDEDKYARTYPEGPDAVFIDDVEFDESTQSYLAQVSITIVDPSTRAAVGAMTIGLNAEQLF